jgi:hypothetical protein
MDQDRRPGPPAGEPLNVLILYDQWSVYTNTVREHLDSFARFSRHRIAYAHAAADGRLTFPLDGFDAVLIHYTIRLAYDWHISPEFAWALRSFRGLKALFIQDEYDHTWRACQWIEQLGIRLVFTCVPPEHVRSIYTRVDHDRVTFLPTLTGYLPIDSDLGKHVKPLADRRIVIGYRGRALPFRYGRLAREKLTIGVRMRAECESRGVPHDIEWTEDRRIYGPAWVDFVASCRATLGTESGSNVFDFDGSLSADVKAALAANPKMTYEEVESTFLAGREMDGVMNQVSPRIFEAVALRTGLILFEGTYSGVVKPDQHFIPLKKDFSNVDEVLRRVRDDRELSGPSRRPGPSRRVAGRGRLDPGGQRRGRADVVRSGLVTVDPAPADSRDEGRLQVLWIEEGATAGAEAPRGLYADRGRPRPARDLPGDPLNAGPAKGVRAPRPTTQGVAPTCLVAARVPGLPDGPVSGMGDCPVRAGRGAGDFHEQPRPRPAEGRLAGPGGRGPGTGRGPGPSHPRDRVGVPGGEGGGRVESG